jgi:hypothetical protein
MSSRIAFNSMLLNGSGGIEGLKKAQLRENAIEGLGGERSRVFAPCRELSLERGSL